MYDNSGTVGHCIFYVFFVLLMKYIHSFLYKIFILYKKVLVGSRCFLRPCAAAGVAPRFRAWLASLPFRRAACAPRRLWCVRFYFPWYDKIANNSEISLINIFKAAYLCYNSKNIVYERMYRHGFFISAI